MMPPLTIKARVAVLLLAAFALIAVTYFVVLEQVVITRFESLETNEALRDVERVSRGFHSEISHLASLGWDYAAWDETYEFVAEPYEEYVDSNLVPQTFFDNRINLLAICDIKGNIIWSRAYNLGTGTSMAIPGFPESRLPEGHPLFYHHTRGTPYKTETVKGIVQTGAGLMVAASQPILTSENQGPVRGFLIMGRFLNESLVNSLIAQTRVLFSITPGYESQPAADPDVQVQTLRQGATEFVFLRDRGDDLTVLTPLFGVNGRPVATIRARLFRNTMAGGLAATRLAFFLGLGTCGLTFLILYLIVRWTVLTPISRLTDQVLSIGDSGSLSDRLSILRGDEIGTLGNEFNRMIAEIERSALELGRKNALLRDDVARREAAEKSLKESENYFRSILRYMEDDIVIIDSDRTVSDANKDSLPALGFQRETILGAACGAVFSALSRTDQRGDPCAGVDEVFESGLPCQFRCRTVQGRDTTYTDVALSPLRDEAGRTVRVIASFRDVTQEEDLTSKLEASRRMEAVGTLAGGVAHDFNNILMSMMLNIEFAIKKADQPDLARPVLEKSLAAGNRARDLIQQLLAFSRGRDDDPQVLSITPVLKETLKLLSHSTPDNVDIRQEIPSGLDRVMATPTAIQQLLVNLYTNALHAMKADGGTLAISLANVEKCPEIKGEDGQTLHARGYLRLTVADTGHGIPAEDLGRIFEPFYTTKRVGEGTGLGLAVVHGIVEKLGGVIRVESRLGEGATFEVFLPLAKEAGETAREPAEDRPDRPWSVLVVEDEDFLRSVLIQSLGEMGYKVRGEASAEGALERFSRDPLGVDVVASDLRLPGMNGIELAGHMAGVRPDLPVILCTGFSEDLDSASPLPENIVSVEKKPIVASLLSRAILDALGKRAETQKSGG